MPADPTTESTDPIAEFRTRVVTAVDGVHIPVVETGPIDGSPIVFVHGLASSHAAWSGVMRDGRLAERFRLIAFDLRGHGDAAQPLTGEQLDATTAAINELTWSKDLDAVVAGLTGVHVVGWSFGCRVTAGWLHQRGGLGNASGVTFVAGPSVLAPLPEDDPAAGAVRPDALPILFRAAEGGERAYAELLLGRVDHSTAETFDEGRVAAVAAVTAMTNPRAVTSALGAPFDYRPFLAELAPDERRRMRALIVSDDLVFEPKATRASWTEAGVATSLVGGQPHAWPITDPTAFVSELLTQLDATIEEPWPR
ncbi:alpha/beta hydrolase [uncultured Leifsonia sp.]|uniref:alpha/beta fold hydrolase n=1 Tax=uncultured Leifsonia sp. TaxID=340359 RepID=UPI0028D523F1|nr:alpha/beta hydrolase [uncultured Leifsonia sp.]